MDSLIIGQLNLHNDRIATSELDRLLVEQKIDIVLVQEQYQRIAGLSSKLVQLNNKARAGIYVCNSKYTVTAITHLMTSHCAVAELSCPTFTLFVVSCYFQFSHSVIPHIHQLRTVLRSLVGRRVIIGADVNCSSPLWGGRLRTVDADRRQCVEDFIAEMNLCIHNTPDAPPTYSSPSGESSIDVTLSSADVSDNIKYWRVLPDASCSDHRLIVYEFLPVLSRDPSISPCTYRYNYRKADWHLFGQLFASHCNDFNRADLPANDIAELMSNTFTYCADVAIGRASVLNLRRCDWWNPALIELRKAYRRARRKFNKLRKSKQTGSLLDNAAITLRVARSRYRAAVEKSKGNLLRKVVSKLESEGPWSPIYHEFKANRQCDRAFISNIKIDNIHTLGVAETSEALLTSLIPDDDSSSDSDYHRQVRAWASVPPVTPMSPLPTLTEFNDIVSKLSTNKAPGDDKISNRMIKEACKYAGEAMLLVYNRCISEGTFPAIWRRGNIKLIPKSGNKPPDDPKSYRPITMLPSLGKLLERLVVSRLIPGGPTFHDNQYGFTLGRSTLDAAISVRSIVSHSKFKYVVGIFLDISGAFDNAWWPILLLKLKNRGCYWNIYSLIRSYFCNGSVKLKFGHHEVTKTLSQGCPQGSVLGPYLWNLGFDDFLALPLPSGCTLTGYADDGLLIIQADTRDDVENLGNRCMKLISDWGIRNRLNFAPHKTYQLLLKGILKGPPRIKFNGVTIKNKTSVCYLGLILERNFSFVEHIREVGEKAKRNFYALTRISTSTWGLTFNTLKIIYSATYLGCICYGSPVFSDRATIGAVRRKLLQSQRLALIFLCKAYRTVSTEALPVLAGVLPVDLEIQRRASMYYSKHVSTSRDFLTTKNLDKINRLYNPVDVVYDLLISEWQTRWDISIKGRHLYKFFPSIRDRLKMHWLFVDHCVAQFLTGHGNFRSKLYSFKLVPSPLCNCSNSVNEFEQTAHHILWECELWRQERNTMLNSLEVTSGAVYYMDLVASRSNFRAFRSFCNSYYWNQK